MPAMLPDGPIVVHFPSGLADPVTPGEKFARWTEALLRILDAVARYLPWPLLQSMRLRVQRINARFQALARKIEAGELQERPSRAGQVRARERSEPDDAGGSPAKPGEKLPRGKGWMVRLCGYHMGGAALQLQLLLADPEIKAMIASHRQLARLLRPFIEMLGIDKSLLPPPDGRRRGGTEPVAADADANAAGPPAADPAIPDLLGPDPVILDPGVSDPVAADPGAAEPVAADPGAADPVVADPVAADPVAADPWAAEPVAAETTVRKGWESWTPSTCDTVIDPRKMGRNLAEIVFSKT